MFKTLLKSSKTLKAKALPRWCSLDSCKIFWKTEPMADALSVHHRTSKADIKFTQGCCFSQQLKPTWGLATTVSPLCSFLATQACPLPCNSLGICLTLCRIISALQATRKITEYPRSKVCQPISLSWGKGEKWHRGKEKQTFPVIGDSQKRFFGAHKYTSALRISRDYHTYSIPKT